MGVNIIDSLFVALGFKTDTRGLEEFEKKAYSVKDSLLSLKTALVGFIAGEAVKKVADIGREFENNRIAIAGYLSALGLSGDFNKGLEDADTTIKQITKDAAALPGEAEDYIQVFKAGLPFVQEALGKNANISDITKFTNKLAAVGIGAMNLNPALIGHEAEMLLAAQGRASKRFPLFMQLSILMRKLPGQAHLTAESFNAMSQAARFDLINKSLDLMGPALEASKSSFDALWGATKSGIKQITRLITAGLFVGMKQVLDGFNNLLYDTNGNLTDLGQGLVENGKLVAHWIGRIFTVTIQVAQAFGKFRYTAVALKVALALLVPLLAGLAFRKFQNIVMGVVGSLLKLRGAVMLNTILIGALAIAVGIAAEDLWGFYHGADSVTGLLLGDMGPAVKEIIDKVLEYGSTVAKVALIAAVAWAAMTAPILVTAAAIIFLIAQLKDLAHRWDSYKLAIGIPKAKVLDFIEKATGTQDKHSPGLHEAEIRANMGAAMDAIDAKDAADKARKEREAKGLPEPGQLPTADNYAKMYGAPRSVTASPAVSNDGFVPVKEDANGLVRDVNHQTITINVNGAQDPKAVAREVDRKLEERNRKTTRNKQSPVAY